MRVFQSAMSRAAWVAIPICVLTSIASVWFRSRKGSETCFGCREAPAQFQCPRCEQKFCRKSACWNSRGFRCERCQQLEVQLFFGHEPWWSAHFGKGTGSGSCMKCLKPAADTDVRECGQCHWQLCKRCWNLENARCHKCDW